MTDTKTLLAIFSEIDFAADAVDVLRELGVKENQMDVVSGAPITVEMVGRPHVKTRVPLFAMGGAAVGLLVGLFFAVGTPNLYSIYVGGHPLIPVPPSVVVVFEMIMLGLMISTFLGVFLESLLPTYKEKLYTPEISDGKIAVIAAFPGDRQQEFEERMKQVGAEVVRVMEGQVDA
jgi:hypothetical protein